MHSALDSLNTSSAVVVALCLTELAYDQKVLGSIPANSQVFQDKLEFYNFICVCASDKEYECY